MTSKKFIIIFLSTEFSNIWRGFHFRRGCNVTMAKGKGRGCLYSILRSVGRVAVFRYLHCRKFRCDPANDKFSCRRWCPRHEVVSATGRDDTAQKTVAGARLHDDRRRQYTETRVRNIASFACTRQTERQCITVMRDEQYKRRIKPTDLVLLSDA